MFFMDFKLYAKLKNGKISDEKYLSDGIEVTF